MLAVIPCAPWQASLSILPGVFGIAALRESQRHIKLEITKVFAPICWPLAVQWLMDFSRKTREPFFKHHQCQWWSIDCHLERSLSL